MNNPLLVFQDTGPFAFVILAYGLFAGLVAVGSVAAWAANQRVSPGFVGVVIGAGALTPLVASGYGLSMSLDAVARASAEMRMALVASGVGVALGSSRMTTVLLGSVLVGFISASGLVAAIRGSRSFVAPGFAALFGLVVLVCGTAAGMASEEVPLRVGLYAVCLLPVVLGLTVRPSAEAGVPPSVGPLAAAASAAAYAALVAVCEAGSLANGCAMLFEALAMASAEMKGPLLQGGLELVQGGRVFAWGAIVAAAGIASIGAWNALEPDRPGQNAGVGLGLLGALVPIVVFAWSPCTRALALLGQLW